MRNSRAPWIDSASVLETAPMQGISNDTFGPLIAYLVPGATALVGISPFLPVVQVWLTTNSANPPTISGLLYLTLASLASGMTVSAVRWATIDKLHARTGLPPPNLNFARLPGKGGRVPFADRDPLPALSVLCEYVRCRADRSGRLSYPRRLEDIRARRPCDCDSRANLFLHFARHPAKVLLAYRSTFHDPDFPASVISCSHLRTNCVIETPNTLSKVRS